MKKFIALFLLIFLSEISWSQPQYHNIHIAGFQRSNFKLESPGNNGSVKFGNISFVGLAINDKAVFHLDMTYLVNALINPNNNQGGVFEFGIGLPFASKEKSRWAWSFDVMFRKGRMEDFKFDSTASVGYKEMNYGGIGGSLYYVRTIGDFIYITPKISFAYGSVALNSIDNRRDFMADAAISIGFPITNNWGLSGTFGIYGSSWEYENNTATEFSMGYMRVGLAYLWKKE